MEVYSSERYIEPMSETVDCGDGAPSDPPCDPLEVHQNDGAPHQPDLPSDEQQPQYCNRQKETMEDKVDPLAPDNDSNILSQHDPHSPAHIAQGHDTPPLPHNVPENNPIGEFPEEENNSIRQSPPSQRNVSDLRNDESHHLTPQSHCDSPQVNQDQGQSQQEPSHQQINLNSQEDSGSIVNDFPPTSLNNSHPYPSDVTGHNMENPQNHGMFSDPLANLTSAPSSLSGGGRGQEGNSTQNSNEQMNMTESSSHELSHINLPPPGIPSNSNMPSMISPSSSTPLANALRDYCDTLSNMRPQNCNSLASQDNSFQDNGHCSSAAEIHGSHSRPNSVYDFDPSAAGSNDMSMVNMGSSSLMNNAQDQSQLQQPLQHDRQAVNSGNKGSFPMIPLDRCESFSNKRDDVLSHINTMSHLQHSDQSNNGLNSSLSALSGNDSLNQSYDSSLSVSSTEFPSTASCYDPMLMRRGRGRPRGSKNGTGMGRGKSPSAYRFGGPDDRTCTAYDLRHLPDPFGTARRGRPRSRFIVDLGEQNHEAWTKARLDLNVSDAELTTLLLSLLESRRDLEDSAESDTMLGLIGSEFNKWKEKFSSQVSMLSHFASIHNTNCCTCLGIKKKKITPVGTGKRGRPRKYPPPVGYGPGMQRPDTIDEDGNIFEPQCILKDGTIVKAEPHDEKPKLQNGEGSSDGSNPGTANDSLMSSLPPRAMLTHEEMQKRREYYSNHKNKIKYVCHYCQVHFYHKPNFDYHISKLEREGKCRIYDKVNNLYLCEACGEGFSWREKLEKHLRLAEQHGTHNQKELLVYGDFQCSMCGKTFNKRNTYLQHIKWHEDREDVPCVICATMFKQTDLRRHLLDVHNNDSLPCCYCGKLFTSRKYLEKHELVHQSGNFPCPECGKCFSQKMAMQHHLRSHSLDKEYSCEACGQMFTQRLGLCHHLRKQFGPAEFNQECTVCSTYFCNEYDLQIHKRKVHNMTEHMEELPPESYLPINMRNHHMSQGDRSKHYNEANNMVKNMLGVSLGNLDNSMNMAMKSEGDEPMDDGQGPNNGMRESSRNNSMNEIMRNPELRDNLMRDNRETLMRDNLMRENLLRDDREAILRDDSMGGNLMRDNNVRNDTMRDSSVHNEENLRDDPYSRNDVMRSNLLREEEMRNSLRNGGMQDEVMREDGGRDERLHGEGMSDDHMRNDGMRDNLRDNLLRENPLRELAMRSEGSLRDDTMRENNPILMNEHMRHMVERRELDAEEQELRLNPSLHNMHHQNNEELHVPQDLTRMASQSLIMGDNRNSNTATAAMSNAQQHMSDINRQPEDSPSRLSDTPGGGSHMSDQIGRMAVENFSRMTSTPGGYLAEHIRRMAENQSRSGMASVMSDTAAAMMSHYDDRDYSRIDNLRSMSRASPADPMARLGDNLSHMGVIRPSQTPSSTPQWPPHMQNHSPLDGMNQSPQSAQHAALYPLPFWPYDPSLRHYNH